MYQKLISEWSGTSELPRGVKLGILDAVLEAYPMIVLANLTTNEYVFIKDEGFLNQHNERTGNYDDMIDLNVENIHPNYQELFIKCFERKNLLKNYANEKNDIYAELYQKNHDGSDYNWVSCHSIRVYDESEDVIHLCLNRVLSDNAETFMRR